MREWSFWVPISNDVSLAYRADALFTVEGDLLAIVERLPHGWYGTAIPPLCAAA